MTFFPHLTPHGFVASPKLVQGKSRSFWDLYNIFLPLVIGRPSIPSLCWLTCCLPRQLLNLIQRPQSYGWRQSNWRHKWICGNSCGLKFESNWFVGSMFTEIWSETKWFGWLDVTEAEIRASFTEQQKQDEAARAEDNKSAGSRWVTMLLAVFQHWMALESTTL